MMQQQWISHQIGRGVVLTRQPTAMLDGELQSASYARMLPGNVEQIYPDKKYDAYGLALKPDEATVDLFYMNFEGGKEYVLLVHRVGGDSGAFKIYDLNNLTLSADGLQPNTQEFFDFTPSQASLVNRGAEYFLNIVGTDTSGDKAGHQKVLYINSAGSLRSRRVGFDPTSLEVSTERSLPQLSANLWDRTDIQSGAPQAYPGSTAYTVQILVFNHLYGSFANLLEEWPLEADHNDAFSDAFAALRTPGATFEGIDPSASLRHKIITSMVFGFVPATKVTLRISGEGYVFGYWVTEYDDEFAIESAPSAVVTSTSGDPQFATLDVEIDWQQFLDGGHLEEWVEWAKDNTSQLGVPIPAIVDPIADAFRSDIAKGNIEPKQSGSFPLTAAQKDDLVTKVSVGGTPANARADKARLYRQNLGFYDRYLVEWTRSHGNSPQPTDPVGEGPRNAEDIVAGRIVRQGGLLTTLDLADIPTEYTDDLKASGVSDPGFPYPTINYVSQGNFGVYEYLRRPAPSSVCANMAQSLIRVEHKEGGVTPNIALVSPVEDPEQAPLRYAIPVVTERQDEIKAIQSFRDVAIFFTSTSALRLNYIPFEGNNQQDRVLTQLTSNHGIRDQRRSVSVETNHGQLAVWLSATSLMATNGMGVFDICPDFSVQTAEAATGWSANVARLVNNAAEYRLELWMGPYRWDFLYHTSHMKDIRGDGYGLVFKLMGPTKWYDQDGYVRAACTGVVSDKFRTMHVYQDSQGGQLFAVSSDTDVAEAVEIRTRRFMGKNPESRLKSIRLGAHVGDVDWVDLGVENTSPHMEYGGSTTDLARAILNPEQSFCVRTPEDALGSSGVYIARWAGGPLGPLWVETVDDGTGR